MPPHFEWGEISSELALYGLGQKFDMNLGKRQRERDQSLQQTRVRTGGPYTFQKWPNKGKR